YTASRVPPGYPQQDNPSTGDNPALAYESNSEDVMDIGYHYLGSMRHPGGQIARLLEDFHLPTANVTRDVELLSTEIDSVALLAPLYDAGAGQGVTLAVLGGVATGPSVPLTLPLMVWDFEAGALFDAMLHAMPSPSAGEATLMSRERGSGFEVAPSVYGPFEYEVSSLTSWGVIQGACVTAAAGANPARASARAGTLFLATVVGWPEPYEYESGFSELYVWRSTDGGENWSLIGARLHPWSTTPLAWAADSAWIPDVALATNNDHLWVFWTEGPADLDGGNVTPAVLGTVIPEAANPAVLAGGTFSPDQAGVQGGLVNFSAGSAWESSDLIVSLGTTGIGSVSSRGLLDAVFDFAWDDFENDGTPAITYRGADRDAYAARVELNEDGEIIRLFPESVLNLTEYENSQQQTVALEGETEGRLAITVNHLAPDYSTAAISLQAGFRQGDGSDEDTWGRGAVTVGSSDLWLSPPVPFALPLEPGAHPGTGRTDPDVTWRFDGRVRQLAYAGPDGSEHLATNTEAIPVTEFLQLSATTNAESLRDPCVLYSGPGHVAIIRLDP
ncbi:MAG: hypothetical protein HUU25_14620, partial [Candidatus Sumerlaeia bacterium]|nr:hypothetical protein [Candidatus Sumerlaeia bacterium]